MRRGLRLQPRAHAPRIGEARVLAVGIEQHHDQRAALDPGLEHQAAARLGDVAGLLHDDVPTRVAHQRVGVVELHRLPADAHRVRDVGRIIADRRVAPGGVHQSHQVLRARHVAARQARRIDEARVAHAERDRLAVHGRDDGRHAAGVVAPECMRRAVLRGHQREVQQLAAREARAHGEARAAARLLVVRGDPQALIQRLAALEHHERGHQLGDGGDRRGLAGIAREQHRG